MPYPTPHGDKLQALLENEKLPADDRPRVEKAIDRYNSWLVDIENVAGFGDACIEPLLQLLNSYKLSIDLELVFDSQNDFLYRQKGQLKGCRSGMAIVSWFRVAATPKTIMTTLGPVVFRRARYRIDLAILPG